MDTLFFICAVLGGSILVLQTILLLLGGDVETDIDVAADFDGDIGVDVDGDIDAGDVHGATAALKFLTMKTIVAFIAFFGLVGLGSLKSGADPTMALVFAAPTVVCPSRVPLI